MICDGIIYIILLSDNVMLNISSMYNNVFVLYIGDRTTHSGCYLCSSVIANDGAAIS